MSDKIEYGGRAWHTYFRSAYVFSTEIQASSWKQSTLAEVRALAFVISEVMIVLCRSEEILVSYNTHKFYVYNCVLRLFLFSERRHLRVLSLVGTGKEEHNGECME